MGDRRDPLLLEAAHGKKMPLVDGDLHCALDEDGVCQLVTVPPDIEELARARFTPDKIDELMAYFDFTSLLRQTRDRVSHVVEFPPTMKRVNRALRNLFHWMIGRHLITDGFLF